MINNLHCVKIFLLFFLVSACGSTKEVHQRATIRGITLELQEIANDGNYEMYPEEKFRKVDAYSILRLNFKMPPNPSDVESSPEWQTLHYALEQLLKNGEAHHELSKRAKGLTIDNATPDSAFISDSQKLNENVIKILGLMVNPPFGVAILTPAELTRAAIKYKDTPHTGLANTLNEKREELHRRAAKIAQDTQEYEIFVRAFLMPNLGQKRRLHIPKYDDLQSGEFRPQNNPTGLLPTQEESKRLFAEIKAAQKAKSVIKEIRLKGSLIEENIKNIVEDFKTKIENLESNIRSELMSKLPADWEVLISDDFIREVKQISTPNNEAIDFGVYLEQVKENIESIDHLLSIIKDLRVEVKDILKPGNLSFSKSANLISKVEELKKSIDVTKTNLSTWQIEIEKLEKIISTVLNAATNSNIKKSIETIKTDLSVSMVSSFRIFEELLSKSDKAASVILSLSENKILDAAHGMQSLDSEEATYIPHPLDDLKPAELNLRYSGILVGDNISFEVDIRRKDEDAGGTSLRPPAVIYNAEVTLAGWHRRYKSNVIFSKTFEGSANKDFIPNVAISLEWHNFVRKNPNSIWNKLDPGFGFHATFLDQDSEQNVETGGGINLSIIGGMIQVGYGYNISSNSDNEYWFFGFGLFSLLGQLRDSGGKVLSKVN